MARIADANARQPPADAAETPGVPSRRLLLGLLVFVLLFGTAGYAQLGNRAGLFVEPGAVPADATGVDNTPQESAGAVQLEALAQGLTERVQQQPDDAAAWSMLGRVYGARGDYAQALAAYRQAIRLRPDNAQAYADGADALGAVKGHRLEGEPEALIAKALQLDPDNAKALALAGSLALARGDAAGALQQWQRALRRVDPGSTRARQLQLAIESARRRSGLEPVNETTSSQPPTSSVSRADSSGATAPHANAVVQLRITLAPALKAQAAPDDTVFVFARAVQGPPVPLAIQRHRVSELPLELVLDDTMAMDPALRLSGAGQVVVGARISKTGDALPRLGDLQGLSGPVAVGARGVRVEIADIVN